MKLILFTSEDPVQDEVAVIRTAISSGFFRIHVKRSSLTESTLRKFLSEFDRKELSCFVLHSHYELASEFEISGIHFSEKNRREGSNKGYEPISTSFHSVSDLNDEHDRYQYFFIGPVFNSISKEGYKGNSELLDIPQDLKHRAVPVGGIDSTNIRRLSDSGFRYAAVRGSIWSHADPFRAVSELIQFKNRKELI